MGMDLIDVALAHEQEWKRRCGDVPVKPAGILPSESVLLCGVAVAQKCDVMIESGRKNGYSTETLCRHVPRYWRAVMSCESHPIAEVDERLTHKYPWLRALDGDGREMVPRLVHINLTRRVGVFMDGPKGQPAFKVAEKILPHVAFVAIHDCHPVNEGGAVNFAHAALIDAGGWSSRCDEFAEALGYLDVPAWAGTYSGRAELTRYGYGLGIIKGGRWE